MLGPGISGEGSPHSQSTYPRRREGAGVPAPCLFSAHSPVALLYSEITLYARPWSWRRATWTVRTHQSPGGWAVFLTKDQLMLLRNPMPS
jgi:hypothetical protein